jgi:hypothetical protein
LLANRTISARLRVGGCRYYANYERKALFKNLREKYAPEETLLEAVALAASPYADFGDEDDEYDGDESDADQADWEDENGHGADTGDEADGETATQRSVTGGSGGANAYQDEAKYQDGHQSGDDDGEQRVSGGRGDEDVGEHVGDGSNGAKDELVGMLTTFYVMYHREGLPKVAELAEKYWDSWERKKLFEQLESKYLTGELRANMRASGKVCVCLAVLLRHVLGSKWLVSARCWDLNG